MRGHFSRGSWADPGDGRASTIRYLLRGCPLVPAMCEPEWGRPAALSLATATAVCVAVKRYAVRALYWRLSISCALANVSIRSGPEVAAHSLFVDLAERGQRQ
jgi:hypothetical protein